MRYGDISRPRGMQEMWIRLAFRLRTLSRSHAAPLASLDDLTDAQRRDIGLPEQVRFMDWRSLRGEGWR